MRWIQIKGGSFNGVEDKYNVPDLCDGCGVVLDSICCNTGTIYDPEFWAWLCSECFDDVGVGTGIGVGQVYKRVEG